MHVKKISLLKAFTFFIPVMLCISYDGLGQTMSRKTYGVGIDFSFYYNLDKNMPTGSLYLGPGIEYYFINNLGIGLQGVVDVAFLSQNGVSVTRTGRYIAPYLKWYAIKGLNFQGGTIIELDGQYESNIRYGIGYSFFFGRRTALTPLFMMTHHLDSYVTKNFSGDFAIGLHYYFNR